MKQTLTFVPSLIPSTQSRINPDAFDQSVEAFDGGKPLEAFHLLLDYVNPELRETYGNAEGTEFVVPHGSIIVTFKLEDEQLKITAPFLSLPEKNRIPLLRQLVTLNFVTFDLAQVALKGDQLYFEYSCPLALVNPYKIYYVLEEICRTGDKYDDEFETKFGAGRIYEPEVKPYDPQTVDRVYDALQQSCKECMDALSYFETNRQYGYAWNVIATTMLKFMFFAHPQGQLLNVMNQAIREHDREDIPLPEVVAIGKELIESLQKTSKESLAEDLYYVETFIPPKRRSSLSNIQENFKNTYERASKALDNDDHMACCVLIIYKFYEMYHYNDVQDDINAVVVKALKATSGKPWDEAAEILYQAIDDIMEDNLEPDEDDDDDEQEGFDMTQYMENVQQMQQNAMQAGMQQMAAMQAQIAQMQQQAMQGVDMEEYMKNMQQMMASMYTGNNGENE